jgi:hypothetical protein
VALVYVTMRFRRVNPSVPPTTEWEGHCFGSLALACGVSDCAEAAVAIDAASIVAAATAPAAIAVAAFKPDPSDEARIRVSVQPENARFMRP